MGETYYLPSPMRVNQGGSGSGWEDTVGSQFPPRQTSQAHKAGRAGVAPDVANVTQQLGQPVRKACHGLGGAGLWPWLEGEEIGAEEKGGGEPG